VAGYSSSASTRWTSATEAYGSDYTGFFNMERQDPSAGRLHHPAAGSRPVFITSFGRARRATTATSPVGHDDGTFVETRRTFEERRVGFAGDPAPGGVSSAAMTALREVKGPLATDHAGAVGGE